MINSKIEWCHHTANLWIGCQRVHAGCDNCYAEAMDNRWSAKQGSHWGPHAPRRKVEGVWSNLAKFQRAAESAGEIHRVFVGSMMDIFEKPMPLVDSKGNTIDGQDTVYLRDLLFQHISVGIYPNLMFLLLTKRPGNIIKYIPEAWKIDPPVNVMYGCSPVDQVTADEMIPKLLQVPGIHFLSCEPLLGPIDLSIYFGLYEPVNNEYALKVGSRWESSPDWVIVGGESGHNARPMNPNWVHTIRKQCNAAKVPFLFKQWGEWHESDLLERPDIRQSKRHLWPDGKLMYNVGKKESGRLLFGKEYNEFPM